MCGIHFTQHVVMKKEEEIGRLRSYKSNENAERRDMSSSSYSSTSPSVEATRPSRTDFDNGS